MITVLTDFGNSEYVGVMKGVILSHYPNAVIYDLFHNIQPTCIKQGAWLLWKNYSYFPKGTVFLCVVDPGVGSERQALAVQTKEYFFVGPDNGLLFPAVQQDGFVAAVQLSREGASKTFHGRDIFAKAGALLEKGTELKQLGKQTELQKKLSFHLHEREGEIVHVDHFGNIITTVPSLDKKQYAVTLNKKTFSLPFYATYQEAKDNELFLIEGSSNTLEISLNGKSALEKLAVKIGDKIKIDKL